MANQFLPKSSPIWGWPMNFSMADLQPSDQPAGVPLIDSATTSTSSAATSFGARGVTLQLTTEVNGATCNMNLYQVINGSNVLVMSWAGIGAGVYFAGNQEHVDLQANPIVVEVDTISAGSVSVLAKTLY